MVLSIIPVVLNIRVKQCYRLLKEIGLILLVLVAPIAFVGLMGVLEVVARNEFPEVGIYVTVLLFFVHLQRRDHNFLKQIPIRSMWIYLMEYSFALLPVSLLFLLLVGDWKNPLVMQIGGLLIGLIPPARRYGKNWLRSPRLNWFPLDAFEWRCGLRKNWFFIGLVYVLGLLLAKFVATTLLIVILLAYGGASVYNQIEGKEIIEQLYFQKPFLRTKTWTAFWVFNAFLAPHYLLFLLLHTQYWYLLLVAIIVAFLLFCVVIFYKYANFFPGRVLVNHQMILAISMVALFSPLMPVFLPGILIYLFVLWQRAHKNLQHYYAEH
ncbi:MAG: hypothetical protein AAF990_01160 [Bacteroidota bacterium]